MSLFTVNRKECRRDGLCVAQCPGKLIEIIGEEGFPTPIAGAEELCINCGHCVSICPHEALSLKSMSPKDCLPVRKELLLSPEHCEHFLRYRRSIRSYKEKRVSRDLLQKLIEIARYAPTGHNRQSVRWLVVEDPAKVMRLGGLAADWMRSLLAEGSEFALSIHMDRIVDSWDKGIDRILRSAPHLVIAHGLQPISQTSCVIALTYLELAAPSLGLGACWAGAFNAAANSYPPLQEVLALPPGHLPYGTMMIGYPKYSYQRMPPRNKPKISWRS